MQGRRQERQGKRLGGQTGNRSRGNASYQSGGTGDSRGASGKPRRLPPAPGTPGREDPDSGRLLTQLSALNPFRDLPILRPTSGLPLLADQMPTPGFPQPLYQPPRPPSDHRVCHPATGMQPEPPLPGAGGLHADSPHAPGRTRRHCESFGSPCPSVFPPSHTEQMDASSA